MIVIDASALAAIIYDEPEASAVLARLGDAAVCAPRLIGYEMANIAATKARRRPETTEQLAAQLEALVASPPVLFDVSWQAVFDIARQAGLSAYDAAYLWLAEELDMELVTLDKRLAARATRRLP